MLLIDGTVMTVVLMLAQAVYLYLLLNIYVSNIMLYFLLHLQTLTDLRYKDNKHLIVLIFLLESR